VVKKEGTYQVLARKWRPQTFEEVVGQEGTVQALKNAIAMKGVTHARLFSGPRGIGVTRTGRLLSRAPERRELRAPAQGGGTDARVAGQ